MRKLMACAVIALVSLGALPSAHATDTPFDSSADWLVRWGIAETMAEEGYGLEDQLHMIWIACRESDLTPGLTDGKALGLVQVDWKSWRRFARELGYSKSDVLNDVKANIRWAIKVLQAGGWEQWRGGRKAPECQYDQDVWKNWRTHVFDHLAAFGVIKDG